MKLFRPLQSAVKVAILDDDAGFLGALSTVLPDDIVASYFTTSGDLDAHLAECNTHRTAERQRIKTIAECGLGGRVSIRCAFVEALALLSTPAEKRPTTLLIIDQYMPGELGTDFCARHTGEGLQRMLLTGMDNDQLVIHAFNQQIIERYVPKHTAGLMKRICEEINSLQIKSDQQRGAPLLDRFPQHLQRDLVVPAIALALQDALSSRQIIEYVAVPEPSGLMAQSMSGERFWIAIETAQSRQALAEIAADAEMSPFIQQQIRSGAVSTDVEVAAILGIHESRVLDSVPLGITQTCAEPGLSVTFFPLGPAP